MKIRYLYIALCGILFAAQTVNAQHNMIVVGNDDSVNVVNCSSMDYATFNANDKWFTITNGDIEGVTTHSITASCTLGLSSDAEIKSLSVIPQVGVCYSKDNTNPTIDDYLYNYPLGSKLQNYTFTLPSLASGTTYYFRPYIIIANSVFYGDVATAKTLGTKYDVDNSKTINGHKFVDLGLSSGLLWAEMNVGAETVSDDGEYFAWGETAPKDIYNWSTYKHGTSSMYITKYNSTDGKKTLEAEDDAATANWGSPCRMPTYDDFEELRNSENCTRVWSSIPTSSGSSINGYKITSTKTGNSILLPSSGFRYESNLYGHGSYGYYWASTTYSSSGNSAYYLGFFSDLYYLNDDSDRYFGRTVRPVAEP